MRVGLIGAGFIGRTHLRAAEAVPELEVVGVVDPQASQDHPDLVGCRFFDDIDELHRREGLDGVIVAVPDALHVPVASHCLRLGLAVMLEKPAATSLAECLRLGRATAQVRERLLVAHQRRHHPASRMTQELIASGRLGQLLAVSGVFALRKDDNYFVERARGVGLTNLIHDLDLLQFFCGHLDAVGAVASHRGRRSVEEDTLALTLEFSSGVVGTMVATDASPSPWGWDQATTELPSIPFTPSGSTYQLLGREASLSIPDMRLFAHQPGQAWHQPLVETRLEIGTENAYVAQLAHFAQVVAGTTVPLVGIDDAIATQAGLEAVVVSDREGRRISTAELVETLEQAA